MKHVLVLKSGATSAPVRVAFGDYDRWFAAVLSRFGCRLHVVDAHLGQRLPEPRSFDGVIVTGSPHSVLDGAPWMTRVARAVVDAAEQGVPVLGVCFGHQLVAHAFGGEVRRNPAGREIGTVSCVLTRAGAADPLFEGIPRSFAVQTTHEDVVHRLPEGAELLAANGFTRNQAFRLGDRVRAVQFHPEIAPETMAAMIAARAPSLAAEAVARGEDPDERLRVLLAGVRGTPHGARLLRNFSTWDRDARRRAWSAATVH